MTVAVAAAEVEAGRRSTRGCASARRRGVPSGAVQAAAAVAHQQCRARRRRAGCRRGRTRFWSGEGGASAGLLGSGRWRMISPRRPARTSASAAAACARSSSCCTTPRWRRRRRRSRGSAIRRPRSRRTISSPRTGGSGGWSTRRARAWHAGAGSWRGAGRRQLALDRDRARQRRAARRTSRRSPSRRWRRWRRCSTGSWRAGRIPAGRGHRPFRHGAGAQGRPGAEVRLAPARARRAGGLAGGGASVPAGGRRSARRPRRRAIAAPEGDWDAVLAASGCASGRGRGRLDARDAADAGGAARALTRGAAAPS